MIYQDLISNVALLLALSILYSLLTRHWTREEPIGRIVGGLLFGVVTIAGMMNPFHYAPGVIFDGRSIVLGMAGFFGGWITAAIAAIITAAYRLWLGGTGAWTGAIVAVTSAALGVAFHTLRTRRPEIMKPSYLYGFGVVLHLNMLLWMLSLPWPQAFGVLKTIAAPVMLIFPVGTLFLGLLLADQERRNYAEQALRESEQHYRSLFDGMPIGLYRTNPDGRILDVNPAMVNMLGYPDRESLLRVEAANVYVNPGDRQRWQTSMAQDGQVSDFKVQLRRYDGSPLWVQEHSRTARDSAGRALHYEGALIDISERVRAEQALHRSNERLLILREMDQAILAARSPEAIAQAALSRIRDIVPCQRASLTEFDLEAQEAVVLAADASASTGPPAGQRMPLDASAITQTLQQGKANVIPDIRTLTSPSSADQTLLRAGIRSYVNVPLMAQDQLLGSLNLGAEEPAAFSQEQIEIARQVADSLAIAIQQAHLHETTRRQTEQLLSLRQVGLALVSELDLDTLLHTIVSQAIGLLQGDAGTLFLCRPDQNVLELSVTVGIEDVVLGVVLQLGEGLSGRVWETGQPLIVEDYQQWEGRADVFAGYPFKANMGVPIRWGEEFLGVLVVLARAHGVFSRTDSDLLSQFATQAAIAIHNARLYQAVQEHARQLEQRVTERTRELAERTAEAEQLNAGMVVMLKDLQAANRRYAQVTRRLEEANAELESFAYSVSHDLRAPLRAISGFAQIIARRHRADLNEEGQQYFDNIIEASASMGRLIDDLLRYSRLGRKAVRRGPVALDRALERVLDNLASRVVETGAQVTVPSSLPAVLGDPTLVEQVLLNLLDNALTYQRAGVTPQIAVQYRLENQNVILGISDNGIGIEPAFHDKVFRMFQRLHAESEYPGTGIGLALVKKAIDLMGGQIQVESVVGQGTTFWVSLPLATKDAQTHS